jgi:hypothetical protein
LLKMDTTEEIRVVPSYIFPKVIEDYEEGICGSYSVENKRIILNEGQWCFSTLIHETLHSRSVFSKQIYSPNLQFVYEGITELLVGLTLKEKLPECYKQWQTIDNCFHNAYDTFVKPWYFLMHKIDFSPIIQLYFNLNDSHPLKQLGKILEKACNNGFAKLFGNYSPEKNKFFDDFRDVLGKAFPIEFATFFETDLRESILLSSL